MIILLFMIWYSFILNYPTSINVIDKVIKFNSILVQYGVIDQMTPFANNLLISIYIVTRRSFASASFFPVKLYESIIIPNLLVIN